MIIGTFELIKSGIEVVDVSLMMFLMVSFKKLAAEDRLESRIAILEVR